MKRTPKMVGGEIGSPLAITVMSRVQRLVNPKPKKPHMIAKRVRTARLFAKPKRRKAEIEDPRHVKKTTSLSGHRSLRYPRTRVPKTEATSRKIVRAYPDTAKHGNDALTIHSDEQKCSGIF